MVEGEEGGSREAVTRGTQMRLSCTRCCQYAYESRELPLTSTNATCLSSSSESPLAPNRGRAVYRPYVSPFPAVHAGPRTMSVSDGDAGKGKGPGSETSSSPSATSLDVQTTSTCPMLRVPLAPDHVRPPVPSSRQIIATLFARFFILPTCIFYAVLTRSGVSFPAHESALLYVSLIVVNIYTAAGYTRWKHARSARRLGASLVPRVKGKWPGNVDVSCS